MSVKLNSSQINDLKEGKSFTIRRKGCDFNVYLHENKVIIQEKDEETDDLNSYLDYILEDDTSEYGGTAFKGETVGDFLQENEGIETLAQLNKALVECGIKRVIRRTRSERDNTTTT